MTEQTAERGNTELMEIVSAISLGTVIDLAQPLEVGMPCSPSHPGFRMAMINRHDVVTDQGLSGASELIVTGGHVGTHIDALCHVALNGKMYGDHDASAASRGGQFSVHGIETVAPFICRGVLADVPAILGVEHLAPEFGITAKHLNDALIDMHIRPGEVVLVRTGWPQRYHDQIAYVGQQTGVPGLTEEAAIFLADLGVRAVGSDTIATDQILASRGHIDVPAHRVLLVERGVHIIEVMNLEDLAKHKAREFLFIAIPLKITGGTASPVRPLAVMLDRPAGHVMA